MHATKRFTLAFTAAGILAACSPAADDPQDAFFATIQEYCGQAFAGEVTAGDEELDAEWMASEIIVEIRECHDDRVRMPLHVGDDRSRTWVLSRTDLGLELKHDHRLEDGSHDPITMYGGETIVPGTATSQSFPADEYSTRLFSENDMAVSMSNTWYLEFPEDEPQVLRYRLVRDDRNFQVDVDLSEPVEAPPAPWGWEDDYEYNYN